jgi:hypothetical protein
MNKALLIFNEENEGLLNCISQVFDSTIIHPTPQISLYDVLDRNSKFDILFCNSANCTNATFEAINEYNLPTVIFGLVQPFPQLKLQILSPSIPQKILNNITTPIYICNDAGHIFPYHNIDYTSDITIYNMSTNIDITLLIQKLRENNIQFKIVGNKIDAIEYIGNIDIQTMCMIAQKTKINIITNKRYLYDLSLNKGFTLSLEHYQTLSYLINDIMQFLNDEKTRQYIINKQFKESITQNTYYHRLIDILNILNIKEKVDLCLSLVSAY